MILTHHGIDSNRKNIGNIIVIGGRRYPFVKIGNQLWLAENLDYKFQYNGGTLPVGQIDSPSTPAAWYYNNNEANYSIDGTYKCGLLYNWYAVLYLENNKDALLPSGWHVPTATEFDTLATNVGGVLTAGTKLKALDNSVTSNWPSAWNGTNDYGFNALPAGRRRDIFQRINNLSIFWTATANGSFDSFYRYFSDTDPSMISYNGYNTDGCSLRLVYTIP